MNILSHNGYHQEIHTLLEALLVQCVPAGVAEREAGDGGAVHGLVAHRAVVVFAGHALLRSAVLR